MDAFGPKWREFVADGARELSCALSAGQAEALAAHARLVAEANRHVNLTSITDPAGFAEKHVLDSLALAPFLPEDTRSLWDLGSGAGYPGLPLAVARPGLTVTLVESRAKKAAFLASAVSELRLANVSVKNARAEELFEGLHPEVIAARAVASLWDLFRLCRPFLAAGGLLCAMKGPEAEAEMEELLKRAARKKLSPVLSTASYRLPSAGRRVVVFVRLPPRPLS